MPLDDDPELTDLIHRFVMPHRRYLKLLHGNYLRMPAYKRRRFVRSLRQDSAEISDHSLGVMFSSEWRSRLTAAYLVAASKRANFVDELGDLLIESQLVYAGQGYCIALASIGTAAAADRLSAYLERWLPDVEARYDQLWAMAALVPSTREPGLNRRGPSSWLVVPGSPGRRVAWTSTTRSPRRTRC